MTMTDRMTVADVMHHGVVTCGIETPLTKIAQMMVGHRIHCVVVSSSEEQKPWGVVSDLDLAAAVAGDQPALAAGDVAATPPVTIDIREPFRRAAELMATNRVTHLIVVKHERPVGVVSALDLARVMAE